MNKMVTTMYDLFVVLGRLSELCLRLYGWLIVIAILMTWVRPDPSRLLVRWIHRLTEPLITLVRRLMPSSLASFGAYLSLVMVWDLGHVSGGMLRSVGAFWGGELASYALGVRLGGYLLVWFLLILKSLLGFLILLLIVWFVLTLIKPSLANPITGTVSLLVNPFISPIQQRFSKFCWVGRVDISPLWALGLVWLLSGIVYWLLGWARFLTLWQ